MTPSQQLTAAVANNDVDALRRILSDCNFQNPIGVCLALRKACETRHLECVDTLIPYAAVYYNQPDILEGVVPGRSMLLRPCDMLYQLVFDTVVPSNDASLFKLFRNLLTSEPHIRQCPVILVQCFEFGHVDLIDELLPFVSDLSVVAQYKPQAYAFFEERSIAHGCAGPKETDGLYPGVSVCIQKHKPVFVCNVDNLEHFHAF